MWGFLIIVWRWDEKGVVEMVRYMIRRTLVWMGILFGIRILSFGIMKGGAGDGM